MGAPIYWNSPNNGPVIYIWGPGDYLKAYKFTGTFQTSPVSQSGFQGTAGFSNAVPLSLSANGNQAGTGIVWANAPLSGDANTQTVTGILRAFDATNLATELWNSQQNLSRDDIGRYAKFNPPTIANGKVYLATFSGQLVAYGLNPPGSGGIQFVQAAAAAPQAPTQTVTVTYPAAQSAGNLNIVVVGWNDAASAVQAVTDNHGNTYSLAIGPTIGTGLTQAIYYAKNIIGGSTTVTVTFNQAAAYPDIRVLEYSGIDPVSPLDVTAGAAGNSATANSGSATTRTTNELIFGANMVATLTQGPGSTFTTRILTTPDGDIAEDRIVSATGAYSASAPLTAAGPWVMQMAAFKASGSVSNPAPTVTILTPNSGSTAGGTAVTIAGTNFVAGATVTFGGIAATGVTVVSPTSITATTPAHAAGAVNVVVTNPDTQSGTFPNGFTYTVSNPAPTVTSLTPTSGSTAGGTAVTISGTNFVAGASVTFGGTAATGVTVISPTSITATTPAHAAGAVNVVVTNPDTQSGTLANGFTYTVSNPAPTVTSLTPTSGSTAGGTAVTITGTNFVTGATVTFGGTAATGVTVMQPHLDHRHHPGPCRGGGERGGDEPGYPERDLSERVYLHRLEPRPDRHHPHAHQRLHRRRDGCHDHRDELRRGGLGHLRGHCRHGCVRDQRHLHHRHHSGPCRGRGECGGDHPDTQSGTLANGFTYTASTRHHFRAGGGRHAPILPEHRFGHLPGRPDHWELEHRRGGVERYQPLGRIRYRQQGQRICLGRRPHGEYHRRPQPGDLLREEHRSRRRGRQHRHGHFQRRHSLSRYPHSGVRRGRSHCPGGRDGCRDGIWLHQHHPHGDYHKCQRLAFRSQHGHNVNRCCRHGIHQPDHHGSRQ